MLVAIRELTSVDRAALAFSLRHLSVQSRYQRYLSVAPSSDARELRRLLDLDHWHHEGLIAFAPGSHLPVGMAEYVRLDDFDLAELSVAVVDGWQHRGVGRALLQALRSRALATGIRRFKATTLRDNRRALALMRDLGTRESLRGEGNLLELIVALSPT